ncbi:uncharacterized protein LOC130910330 [Corythoichthys intestinalis]|uniref:uncharacterized protein LOC130910330 n=1 Tax=Corythoichthys intestinalis TaxID=161448 RepID=UPI0025A645B4|nr:uncharacterized protein LOC130910330 [Corythoichthys intestinalis]
MNRRGTGYRHRVCQWPVSQLTGKCHKLVIPPKSSDKKFALLVGDSHLRAIADGFVKMPEGDLSFGIMSTPGATAMEEKMELANVKLPQVPDVVCVLAPSNDLTQTKSHERAGVGFRKLLAVALSQCSNVVVVDFPPRYNMEMYPQEMLRQEYRRVAAEVGVKYLSAVEHFSLDKSELWAQDGVHLSDTDGMPILVQLLWKASYTATRDVVQVPRPVTVPVRSALKCVPATVAPEKSSAIVRGVEVTPPPAVNLDEWTMVGSKRRAMGSSSSHVPPKRESLHQQPVVRDCFIPLNPVRFSHALLEEMDKLTPSALQQPDVTAVPRRNPLLCKKQRSTVAEVKRRPNQRQRGASSAVVKSPGMSSVKVQFVDNDRSQGGNKGKCVEEHRLQGGNKGKTKSLSVRVRDIKRSVRGSFHQGDARFEFRGVQCMAISLVAVAKHTTHSVFSWQSADLDRVVTLGDELYSSLRKNNKISGGSELLCVPDLPKQQVIDGESFDFEYGDFVTGDVNVVSGDLVVAGVLTPLKDGLAQICGKYDTCFLTLNCNTCAIIKENGMYAVVDSHSRNTNGMVDVNGFSVVVVYWCLDLVFDHFFKLANMMNLTQNFFEIAGVRVIPTAPAVNSTLLFGSTVTQTEQVIFPSNDLPDVFISNVTEKELQFVPLRENVAQVLCTRLNIELQKVDSKSTQVGHLGKPCKNEKVVGDGNCFFRAVSQAVSGTQNYHRKIRLAVVKQIEKNAILYQGLLRSEYSSVAEYLSNSKMGYVGSWATEIEIQAAADYLEMSIFTYHQDRWIEYTCSAMQFSNQALYLENVNANHYENVVCVHLPQSHKCYGYCEVYTTPSVYNIRRQTKKDSNVIDSNRVTSNVSSIVDADVDTQVQRPGTCVSNYLKNKYNRHKRIKYQEDSSYRNNIRAYSKAKYSANLEHRNRVRKSNRLKKQEIKEKSEQFDFVMKQFLDKVKHGPDFVCCVCHRLLFKNQVLGCKIDDYKTKAIASVALKCITEDYLHQCSGKCDLPCQYTDTARGQLWICYCCHCKINKGEVPPESRINNLELEPIPAELACLNSLEQHLIALHIPFMKMLALPKGGQNGVHGPVTCVPANIVQTDNLLPRNEMDGSLIGVKLKRKLTYKGHYEYQFVDSVRIRQALQYLKLNNKHYKDIEFNNAWLNTFCKGTEVETTGNENDGHVKSLEASLDLAEDELLHDRQQHCMFQDTCLMPVDIGQEVLDQYVDNVLNVAPAEGNNPVKLLSDMTNEAKCFPVLFPQGINTFHERRQHKLTLARYFNNRILHADGRFARNVEYIFYAQYMSELQQVISNVSIALRKGKGRQGFQQVDVNILNDDAFFKNLLEFDNGYRFLKPIRGTPAFWQAAQSDLLACVRQLGVPTWFCSFSSADMRWKNLLCSILMQEGRTETLEQLEWADRCELLRHNPVTAARMFDFRWHCFLREVLMSPAEPIGKIKDYFYRIEFQQRGSPHVHCLFWIENAPVINKNSDEEVVAFIDKYVTCELPTQDKELLDIVTNVQQHSKRHSKTCQKKNKVCRFNFPRPPSCRTFICHEKSVENLETCMCHAENADDKTPCDCKKDKVSKEQAATILASVKKALSDETKIFESLEHLFQSVNVSQEVFEEAYKSCARGTQIVMKREINEVWINQYSKPLLKCWNANMDIQFVADAYACVVYIISYISKAEREIGLLLGNAQREAAGGNVSAKEALKNLGSVYLHNRDVCAQEAVYRLTPNLHLKECSRKVVFVPTGDNVVKMSLPLSVLKQKALSHDLTSENIWMMSLVDRYKNRPDNAVFTDMCLATFASEYRILSKNEKSQIQIRLKNDCGFVTKRIRTQPAVVRYMRFSKTKNPELFYRSIMQLFLPYRADAQLKPPKCETFEQFYNNGQVKFFDGSRHPVKFVVDTNRSKFELEADQLDDFQKSVESNGELEDAWCELCPEQELERLETLQLRTQQEQPDVELLECIPELAVNCPQISHLEKRNILSRKDGLALIRSLNDTQRCIFYNIRQWCIQKVIGEKPAPLHVFITGGAGTGKSHLIKAIQYEATRLLSTVCSQPDSMCVLLTAPTGIAAFNLQASTIHATFSIGKDVRLPYTPLGEEKLNSLRAKYNDLKILIIDEISMVDHRLLTYIHGRLRQIKQTGDFSPFGNVSVLAVGDFYQLPPVKGKPLYVTDPGVDLWSSLFKVVELNTVVRQQDQLFAKLLNRIRTRSKETPMLLSDIETLKHCESGEVSSALHIFPTNKQVNQHNLQELFRTCPEYVKVEAQDFVHNKKTGNLELISGHHAKAYNTCLEETLLLGINARVMLCKNVDVVDGLVNGVCGTVTHIITSDNSFPQRVYVKFDKDQVGSQRRKQSATASVDLMASTYIEPEEEKVTSKGGLRRQFPLKLAWACTVHKVQGLTVDSAVVSLNKIFSAGQAYVALSRVRSLSGLIIQDFAEEHIYCKNNIKEAIQRMPPFFVESAPSQPHTFSVFLMNVQGLIEHAPDLAICTEHLQPNCIAVTETWLPNLPASEIIKVDGYSFHSCPRTLSYSGNNPLFINLQSQQHGGVGVFSANDVTFDIIQVPHFNLECAVSKYGHHDILVAVIYRPSSYHMSLFKEHLSRLFDLLEPLSNTIAVMGDFNEDILKSSSVCKFAEDRGYVQLVTQPTTERGTLIDHVYVKTTQYEVETSVVPTYFSDHEGIVCHFRDKNK